jgi:thiol-disulfide isomerase/thioredoxin
MQKFKPFLILFLLASGSLAARDWSMKDSDGNKLTLAGFSGKWVFVNFWATWCQPCADEIPLLVKLRREKENFVLIGVAILYQHKSDVLEFARKKGMSYPIVLGDEDIAAEFDEIDELPTSFLYDPSGKLVYKHAGPITSEEIERAMRSN